MSLEKGVLMIHTVSVCYLVQTSRYQQSVTCPKSYVMETVSPKQLPSVFEHDVMDVVEDASGSNS